MGYYVNITDANFIIPPENLGEAYRALCALNAHDELKTGGSWGPLPDGSYGQKEKWFAWMDANYPETCKDAEAIFTALRFETDSNPDDGLTLLGYDSKAGGEEHFLEAVAPFVKPGSYLEWRGEGGEVWREEYDGRTRRILRGRILWEEVD